MKPSTKAGAIALLLASFSPGAALTQTVAIESSEGACASQVRLAQTSIADAIASKGCPSAASLSGEDYIGLGVTWTPTTAASFTPADVATDRRRTDSNWRQILVALRRGLLFRVEETGIVTMRVFRARSGLASSDAVTTAAGTWSRCGENGLLYSKDEYDLMIVRPLSSWRISERNGFSTETLSSTLSGRQGFVFPADSARNLEVELCLSHVREVTPVFTARLRQLVELATAFGRDTPLVSDAYLSGIATIEADIARQANFAQGRAQILQVGWGPTDTHRIDMNVGVPWTRVSEGRVQDASSPLSVRAEAVGSLFSGPHVFSGSGTRFVLAAGRSQVLSQKLTTVTVEEALDPGLLRTLADETISPTLWETNCQQFERRLAQYPLSALNTQDTQAVLWAGMGTQPRLGVGAVRQQPCSVRLLTDPDRLAAFAASGLAIVDRTVEPPAGDYGQILVRAREAAASADAAASQARTRRSNLAPQTFSAFEPALGGQFSGVLDVSGVGVGRITFDHPDYVGAVWEGDVRRESYGVVAHGLGVFSFSPAASANEGCTASRRTTFSGLAQLNQMRSGQIAYCDNSIFSGSVDENEQPTFGVMRLTPEPATLRLQYGEFSGRRFGTGGQGVEESRQLVDGTFRTQAYKTGLWLSGSYLGE